MKIVKRKVRLNYNHYMMPGRQRYLCYFNHSVKEHSQEAHDVV